MPQRKSNDRLDELLCRLVDGMDSPDECRELEKILSQDSAARERYRLFMAAHMDLATHPRELPERRRSPVSFWQGAGLPVAAAAAVLALVTGAALWWIGPAGDPTAAPPQAQAPQAELPILAVASGVDAAAWDLDIPLATGVSLRSGPVALISGVITLDLVGGQRLTLKAPADFELISEREMMLYSGDAALRMDKADGPAYIINVPGGAVVDLGTEISVNIGPDGFSDVRVFDGKANASVTDGAGRTRHERLLLAGDSVRIGKTLEPSEKNEASFLRSLPSPPTDRSPAGEAYAAAITRSQPLAWWRFDRFDQVENPREVAAEVGAMPLSLGGQPRIIGPEGSRFLLTNDADAAGFAAPAGAIPGLDTEAGFSVECLIYPASEKYGTAVAIDQPDLPPPSSGSIARIVRHPPQRLVIERVAQRGSNIGHVHPDFALRAMMRSPAGYQGGANTYSDESHLMHRWIHVVFTHDGQSLRLYIDGRLSDQVASGLEFQNAALRPIIGRMQPLRVGEKRQWIGGIDEVALYDRALNPAEIRAHFEALEPR